MIKDRSDIIGGSDISAVMGMNRWKTPLQLWAEKKGLVENRLSDFEAAEIGLEMEEYIARWFSRATGIKLRRDTRTFKHAEFPYMVAHIDRWVIGEDAVFEAKQASAWKVKEWEGDKIPQEYILQVMWYLGILGKQTGYIACLIGGNRRIWKRIDFDPAIFSQEVEAAKQFKEQFMDKNQMPIAMSDDSDFLYSIFPQADPSKTKTFDDYESPRINALLEDREPLLRVIKDAERKISEIEARIKQELGDHESGSTDSYYFSWKNQTREYADLNKLKEAGVFDTYKKTADFRTLKIKPIGGSNDKREHGKPEKADSRH